MIQITAQMRVLVAIEPVDGRKGIDSLAQLCQEKLAEDPFSGCVFVFRSRSGTAIRLLSYDGQGYWLAQKRLSRGRFVWWPEGSGAANAHKDNQVFLHSRFGLGGDVLEPYKKIIERWLWPDVLRKQDTSVSQAKQAIADYKKAVGDPEGVAELMVFYCEQAAGFCDDICSDDEGYFDTSMPWCACSSRPSSSPTHYRPTAGMTWS